MTTVSPAYNDIGVRNQVFGKGTIPSSNLTNISKSTPTQVNSSPVDMISISAAALAAQDGASAPVTSSQTSYYAQFFPTRSGAGATALANGVIDPGAQTISAGLTSGETATAARASMDAQYAAMSASGKPYDPDSWRGVDQGTLMSGLDRTALSAVAQNQGGLFTKDEQSLASDFMKQQQGLAMGMFEGPTDLQSKFIPFMGDSAEQFKKGVTFLDKASPYEKSSITWGMARASAQIAYEWTPKRRGEVTESLDSSNSLVNMLVTAMRNMTAKDTNNPGASTKTELLAESWMKGHEAQLDAALKANEFPDTAKV